jgi:hypothetical protein
VRARSCRRATATAEEEEAKEEEEEGAADPTQPQRILAHFLALPTLRLPPPLPPQVLP